MYKAAGSQSPCWEEEEEEAGSGGRSRRSVGGAARVGVWTLHIGRTESDGPHMQRREVVAGGQRARGRSRRRLGCCASLETGLWSTDAGRSSHVLKPIQLHARTHTNTRWGSNDVHCG